MILVTRKSALSLIISLISSTLALSQDGGNENSLADRYFFKADTFLLYNRHDSSVLYFQKAEKLFLEDQNWEGYVATLNKLSENYSAEFELEKSQDVANKALEYAIQYLDEDNLEKATAWNNLGNAHFLRGQHELALEEYEKALEITERVPHDDKHIYSAPTNLGIGNVYFGKLQYQQAFLHFKEALETNKEILGEDHPYVANSYLSLGNLYRNKGSYNLAQENYNTALEIFLKAFGQDHPDVATTYIGIADIFKQAENYEKALQYYNQALIIYTRFLNEINPKFGDIYLGFADIAKNKGDYATAVDYYEKALNLFDKTIGKTHQNSIRSYLGIANTYIYQEKFKEALDYYGKVLEINFNLVGETHVNTSAAYNNLGGLYYFAGDFVLAARYFEKALAIDQAIHGDKHPNVANAHYNLARVYHEMGQTRQALESVQSAINSSIMDFNEDNIFVNPALVNFFDSKDLLWYLAFKGELLEAGFSKTSNMKGLDISLHSFVLSDSLVDQVRKSYTEREDQVRLAKQASKIYESAINGSFSILKSLNEENVKQISQYAVYEDKLKEYQNEFFKFVEKHKGSILFSSLAESNAKSFGGIPDSLINKETALKKQINQYTQELSANPDSAQLVYYQEQLFKVNREYEELIASFEEKFPKYFDLKYDVGVVSLPEFQSFLNDSTMAISYFLTDDSVYSAYITNDDFKVYKNWKNSSYIKDIQALRSGILYKVDKLFTDRARKMYKQLFPGDIPEHIKSLVIVLDGYMATIPFEVFLTEDVPAGKVDYTELPYMIKKYNISYTFSANLLYKTFRNDKILRTKAPKDGIAIAPVSFETPYFDILRDVKQKSYDESGTAESLRRTISLNTSEVTPLPGSEDEVKRIQSIYSQNNKNGDVYMYTDALELKAKENLEDYKYIHFATHGFVNQEEPEFSGILLVPDSTGQEDGILFSGEIYNIPLNSELVTMSACETGLGKISTGEGIIGITRALLYAGTKNVNVSLWKVSDQSTRNLMINLYERLVSKEVPKNPLLSLDYAYDLRKAKLALLNDEKFNRPYYWSPFVLIGK